MSLRVRAKSAVNTPAGNATFDRRWFIHFVAKSPNSEPGRLLNIVFELEPDLGSPCCSRKTAQDVPVLNNLEVFYVVRGWIKLDPAF